MSERARAAARRDGREVYQHEVIDSCPAHTTCGTPIRRNVETGRPGLWRACGCPGVLWQCGMDGWTKHEDGGQNR